MALGFLLVYASACAFFARPEPPRFGAAVSGTALLLLAALLQCTGYLLWKGRRAGRGFHIGASIVLFFGCLSCTLLFFEDLDGAALVLLGVLAVFSLFAIMVSLFGPSLREPKIEGGLPDKSRAFGQGDS